MNALSVILVQGLTFGSIYAVAALGFGLVYNTTRAFHIAYGAISVAGSYLVVSLAPAGPLPKLLAATALAVAATFGITAGVFAGLYRWVQDREGGRLAVFVISLGVAFAIEPVIVLIAGAQVRTFQMPAYLKLYQVAGLHISVMALVVIAAGILAVTGLRLALSHTRWGFQLQALAANPELAELVGSRRRRVIAWMLLAASGLGTVAALLLGIYTEVTPNGGTSLALVAAVAVIAGGVGSYTGAYAFALTVGFLQALTSYVLPGAWTTVGVYGAILLLILLRPSGLGRGWKTAGT